LNLCDAIAIDARRDVDQHDRGKHLPPALALRGALGEQRRDAAERSPDRDRPFAGPLHQRGGNRGRIRGEVRECIMPVRDPLAVAMTALIERVGGRARAPEMLGGAAPRMARLPAAMQQQHRLAGFAIHVRH